MRITKEIRDAVVRTHGKRIATHACRVWAFMTGTSFPDTKGRKALERSLKALNKQGLMPTASATTLELVDMRSIANNKENN